VLPDVALPELYRLALALALGLILGVERGSRSTHGGELLRVAGLRTFGLIGLLGGLVALLAPIAGGGVVIAGLLALVAIAGVGYWHAAARTGDLGATSEIAMLVAFALGALAVAGDPGIAAATTVVVAALLRFKEPLHAWLERVSPAELEAALQLLIIGVVALPLLPDRALGPWDALNPRVIGWLVALIASLSFVGYAAVKSLGAGRGLLLTSLLGGLASSTAVALSFARLARGGAALRDWLAAGITTAAATMSVRLAVEIGVVRAELLPALAAPLVVLAAGPALGAALFAARAGAPPGSLLELQSPLALGVALRWAVALAALFLIAAGAGALFGERGVLFVAAASGLIDVDAISLSLAQMAGASIGMETAARGVALAAITNTLAKAALVASVGGGSIGIRVGGVLFLSALAAALAAYLT
jgi:uncharacterized membrane protein (DUF4010 family)